MYPKKMMLPSVLIDPLSLIVMKQQTSKHSRAEASHVQHECPHYLSLPSPLVKLKAQSSRLMPFEFVHPADHLLVPFHLDHPFRLQLHLDLSFHPYLLVPVVLVLVLGPDLVETRL